MTVCAASVATRLQPFEIQSVFALGEPQMHADHADKKLPGCIDSVALAPLTVPADGSCLRLSMSICGYFCDVALTKLSTLLLSTSISPVPMNVATGDSGS